MYRLKKAVDIRFHNAIIRVRTAKLLIFMPLKHSETNCSDDPKDPHSGIAEAKGW